MKDQKLERPTLKKKWLGHLGGFESFEGIQQLESVRHMCKEPGEEFGAPG